MVNLCGLSEAINCFLSAFVYPVLSSKWRWTKSELLVITLFFFSFFNKETIGNNFLFFFFFFIKKTIVVSLLLYYYVERIGSFFWVTHFFLDQSTLFFISIAFFFHPNIYCVFIKSRF